MTNRREITKKKCQSSGLVFYYATSREGTLLTCVIRSHSIRDFFCKIKPLIYVGKIWNVKLSRLSVTARYLSPSSFEAPSLSFFEPFMYQIASLLDSFFHHLTIDPIHWLIAALSIRALLRRIPLQKKNYNQTYPSTYTHSHINPLQSTPNLCRRNPRWWENSSR